MGIGNKSITTEPLEEQPKMFPETPDKRTIVHELLDYEYKESAISMSL